MKLYTILIVIFSTNFISFSNQIKIIPPDLTKICNNKELVVSWNGSATNILIQAKSANSTEYRKIINHSIKDNTLYWLVNDPELLGTNITIKISDSQNPNNYDEISDLFVYPKTQIIEQTNSSVVCFGSPVYLNVEALGFNLKYQWFKDGEILNGKNSNILKIDSAEYSNSGVYICKIFAEDYCETIDCTPIPVYVTTETKFSSRPDDIEWYYMDTIRILAPLHTNYDYENDLVSFKWYKDTVITTILSVNPIKYRIDTVLIELHDDHRITGTKTQCLQIHSLVWADRTTYRCFATGMCGSDSTSCILGESGLFKVIKVSPDYTNCEGTDVTFKVNVETDLPGAVFSYQWYKGAYKILRESEKYIGTKTASLTIKKATHKEDAINYYVLVTLINHDVSKRSQNFIYEPKYKPTIVFQDKYWIMRGRRNYMQNEAYLRVNVSNFDPCRFDWYKDGKLVFSGINKDYRGGTDSAKNVGKYVCKISNQCGVTWSDTMYIAYGFSDVYGCRRSNLYLNATDLGEDYTYKWMKGNEIITESVKYQNVNSHQLKIVEVFENDEGNYLVFAINKTTNDEIFLGTIYAEVVLPPYIIRDFPDKLINEDDFMRQVSTTVISKGKGIEYTLYLDGTPIQNGYKNRNMYYYDDYGFVLGGRNSNIKPGVYQYHFKGDCGEVWSSKLTVINSNYKPGGIIIAGDDEETPSDVIFMNDNEFKVYPNPASDFITINFKPSEGYIIQIFNTLGVDLTPPHSVNGDGVRIDVSKLPAGVYFVRIGDKVERFVKM